MAKYRGEGTGRADRTETRRGGGEKKENRAKEGEAFRILRRNVNQVCQGSGTASMPAGVR